MANMDNDAYLLFLKQEQLQKQGQAANINTQMPQENQMPLNEFNGLHLGNQEESSNSSGVGDNYLEKALDFIAKQNQLNMNIHLDKIPGKE